MTTKFIKIFFIIFFLGVCIYIYPKIFIKKKISENTPSVIEDISSSSNIIKDVNCSSKDAQGNSYTIDALQGEIDYSNSNIIYLTDVNALIKLKNNEVIRVSSNFGKYNTENYDTIFSKNVKIFYLDNEINSEYLDFSIKRNSMIVSNNVVYTNLENILKADVIEINIQTKDTKIFMYENTKKVNIKSKN